MTRFFFDLHEGGREAVIDEEGAELAGLAAAREHAIAAARDIMAAQVSSGHLYLSCAIVVRDDNGNSVTAVSFAEALAITFATHP